MDSTSASVPAVVFQPEPTKAHRVQILMDDDLHKWLKDKQKASKRGKRLPSLSLVGYRLLQAVRQAEERQQAHAMALAAGLEPRSGERRADAA